MTHAKSVIVVIEDDPQISRFLRTSLSAYGIQLFLAETGALSFDEIRKSSLH